MHTLITFPSHQTPLSSRLNQQELSNFDALVSGACEVIILPKDAKRARKEFRHSLLHELQLLTSDNDDNDHDSPYKDSCDEDNNDLD
jgi:hypothetical protein